MRATVDRKAFVAALKAVVVATKGSSLPGILSGVRIEASSTCLDLCCSSFDLTITDLVHDVSDVEPGVAVPAAQYLARLLDKFDGSTVSLALDDDRLTVTGGDAEATLQCWAAKDWPDLPSATGAIFDLSGDDLALIDAILPMASTDQTTPARTAAHFSNGSVITLNQHRMGIAEGIDAALPPIPVATLRAVAAAVGTGPVEVIAGERVVSFACGSRTWTTRAIEAATPPVERELDVERPYSLTFVTADLIASIQRVSLAANENQKEMIPKSVRIERDGDKAIISAYDSLVGAAVSDVIGCRGDFDEPLGINPSYLLDCLKQVDEEDVTLKLAGPLRSILVRSGRLVMLIVPIRLPASVSS